MSKSYTSSKLLHFIHKSQVSTIFEVGSRDCLDAVDLSRVFNTKVYAFECNPEAIQLCKDNMNGYNVELIEKAVSKHSGKLTFQAVVPSAGDKKSKAFMTELGGSSLYKLKETIDGKPSLYKDYVHKAIEVDSIRLDDFMSQRRIQTIDYLCVDVEGAEMEVLQSLGKLLAHVKYLVLEVQLKQIQEHAVLFHDMHQYLSHHGLEFVFYRGNTIFGNALYKNKALTKTWFHRLIYPFYRKWKHAKHAKEYITLNQLMTNSFNDQVN